MGQRRRADPTLANDRAAARGLELCRERFEVAAGDGGPEKVPEFFGIGDRLDFLAQALGDSLEADFECFEDVFLLRSNLTAMDSLLHSLLHTLLHTFFVELFGECHGGFLEFGGLDFSQLMAEGFFVNIGGVEDIEQQRPEEIVRQQRQTRFVPDFRPEQETKLTGFECAKDHDTRVRALDLIKGNFRKLDEAEGEVGDEVAKALGVFGRQVEKAGEVCGDFPYRGVLREHDGQDDWQFQRAGILGEKLAPDLEHVAKQAQRDPWVFVVLMLEENVKERGAAINRRAEEEVALCF